MKKKIIFMLAACLAGMGHALAGNVLTVSDVNVPQGGEATLEIGCEFDTEFTAFELQLALPEGLSLLTDGDGYPVVERAFDTNHILTGNLLPSNGNYKITCRSMENLSMPTSGPLLRVTVLADASLPLGASLSATVAACEFTRTADSQGENLDDVTFTINITEFRTLLDENSTSAPEPEEDANVRVRRTINAGEWSTIVLPFAMTETQVKAAFGDDVQLGDFTGCETTEDADENIVGITVKFDNATAIEANHPYIIKVSAPVTEFTVDGVDIEAEEAPSVDCDPYTVGKGKNAVTFYNSFVGTYVAQTEVPEQTLFLSGNQFWYSTGLTKMKAFRAYFDFYDVLTSVEEAGSRMHMVFNDDTPTEIRETMNYELKTMNYFDLQGRHVVKPAKGVYVQDGKKVVIK